jgi:hypothetical protein
VAERKDSGKRVVEAQTFILYSQPADQLHDDRHHVVQKDKDGKIIQQNGKSLPIYINTANIDEWKSVVIDEKIATISDKSLKLLTLGHVMAQSFTKNELLTPNDPRVQQTIDGLDE